MGGANVDEIDVGFEYGRGVRSARRNQEWAMPRQKLKSVGENMLNAILEELNARFRSEGGRSFNRMCSMVVPVHLVGRTDQEIGRFDFDSYIRDKPSLYNIDVPALRAQLRMLREHLATQATAELEAAGHDHDDEDDWQVIDDDGSDGGDFKSELDEIGAHRVKQHKLWKCLICTYQYILYARSTNPQRYRYVSLHYHHILTLSVDVDECERSWSGLKFLKTRLRAALSEEHTADALMCYVNADILKSLDLEALVDQFAVKTSVWRRLLQV